MSAENANVHPRSAGTNSAGGTVEVSTSWQIWQLVRFAPWLYLTQALSLIHI